MGAQLSESTADEILMAAYQAGNAAAFEQLFERHGGSVYGFLARRLGDRALAEDLYQETFLRVHRARQTYDSSRPFRAWLFAIAHNLLNDALRQRLSSPSIAASAAARGGDPAGDGHDTRVADVVDPAPALDDRVEQREALRAVDRALAALPPDEATVLILARVEGLSYDDIALVIGRSPSATKQLAYRALKKVRADLAPTTTEEQS